jgi:hypothetical protein
MILAGVHLCAGIVFELPDKKARDFLFHIALNRLFLKYARMVFGEMPVRA